jgi:hypothetical protein
VSLCLPSKSVEKCDPFAATSSLTIEQLVASGLPVGAMGMPEPDLHQRFSNSVTYAKVWPAIRCQRDQQITPLNLTRTADATTIRDQHFVDRRKDV